MPFNDFYEQYRQPLTQEDLEKGIKPAEEQLQKMLRGVEEGSLRRAEDGKGFIDPEAPDIYLPSPVTAEHIGIAMNRAENQFQGWPAMPEDLDVTMRYPGIDPMGKYSVIDMKIAQRMARIEAVLQTRSPEVQAYVRDLMSAKQNNEYVRSLGETLSATSEQHRILTRASKLCLDPDGRELLHRQVRAMETNMAVTLYDQYLQGVEYAVGIRTGPVPQEVQDLYRNEMGMPLNMGFIQQAAQMTQAPAEISVEFENLEHKLQQAQFANPDNWGKKPGEITMEELELKEVSDAIQPYARATARRVLDPLFQHVEKPEDGLTVNRGDLIIIDGKTVREKMYEDYIAAGRPPRGFMNFYEKNYQNAASEYMAAGLMAGKRVEAFIPDKDGKIPQEPTQITKRGYEPKPLQKVVLNAWERYFSKRGFYKEKTAQAAEYQRMMEARERVRATNLKAQWERSLPSHPAMRDPYLRDWMRDNDPATLDDHKGPYNISVDRSAFTSISVCAMLNAGYSLKDVFDPTKLLDQKAAMGSMVLQKVRDGDKQWLGEQMFKGQMNLVDDIEFIAATNKLADPAVLYQEKNGMLVSVGRILFDIDQEKDRAKEIKEEYAAAAERGRPGHGPQTVKDLFARSMSVAGYFDFAKKALDSSVAMASGLGDERSLVPIATFEAFRQRYASSHGGLSYQFENGNTCLQMLTTGNQLLGKDRDFCSLNEQLTCDVEAQKAFGRDMLRGEAQKRMRILAEPNLGRLSFSLKEPTKEAVKQAENNRQLQETARQNAEKAPKSMGGR